MEKVDIILPMKMTYRIADKVHSWQCPTSAENELLQGMDRVLAKVRQRPNQ